MHKGVSYSYTWVAQKWNKRVEWMKMEVILELSMCLCPSLGLQKLPLFVHNLTFKQLLENNFLLDKSNLSLGKRMLFVSSIKGDLLNEKVLDSSDLPQTSHPLQKFNKMANQFYFLNKTFKSKFSIKLSQNAWHRK